jgi:FSR family fosmidomycin resistance protein-like MFS transporter
MGTASGVTLGLAASVGGAFTPVLGLIAQASSLQVTLGCLIPLPAVAWLLGRRLREPATRNSSQHLTIEAGPRILK